MQEGREHWADYYTSPQSFHNNVYYLMALQLMGLLFNFNWLVHVVGVQAFQPLIVILFNIHIFKLSI